LDRAHVGVQHAGVTFSDVELRDVPVEDRHGVALGLEVIP
jgi:hypothetical protein